MKSFFSLLFIFAFYHCAAQKKELISGPWCGDVQMRTATIWAEVSESVQKITVSYYPVNKPSNKKTKTVFCTSLHDFKPVKIELYDLEYNTTYNYNLAIDGNAAPVSFKTNFTTQDLWQYRKPAPNFSFLAGSCHYTNDVNADRPGKPYGNDSSIFETMAKEKAAFHIWMGDNWYTREVDFGSPWGLHSRASRDRSQKVLQPFMAAMPQYSIWDDHDYGPNDAGKSFIFKKESREIFKAYSCNPSYGEDEKGIYTQFSYSDVDFFLTDDRFFRSTDNMQDTIDAYGNKSKEFLGKAQMEWLKNALLYSEANFKVIVVGSQVLNPLNEYECMRNYGKEYNELMNFLATEKIKGVVFFSGDRHHSEVIKIERPGLFPVYDITASSYTAGISKVRGKEADNPARVAGTLVEVNNYGRISVSGDKNNRIMKVEFVDILGKVKGGCEIKATELQ